MVGAFVIGAFALLIVALLTFGGINLFDKPQRFIVYFDESIHGLDLGSPVKLRGVRVGRVVALNVRYDARNNRSVVAVVCELSKDVVTDNKGTVIDVSSRIELQTLVDRGLRARLQVLGLATGLLYVELDLFDPKEYPADPKLTDLRYVVVPYVPSAIVEFQASATEILSKLKKVDFEGITRALTGLVADTRKQLAGIDLRGLAEQWKTTGAELETLARSPDIPRTFENVNGAVADLRATIAKIDAQVEPTSKEFADTMVEAKKMIQALNATATTAQGFIAAHGGLGEEVVETLNRLNEAADAIKRLADFLERNPNALITGRKRPE